MKKINFWANHGFPPLSRNLVLFILFVFAVFFRLVFWKNFGVGFDQVQIFKEASKIISGDLTLIGPRTGPANMFTGPLIYYLSVPFVYLFGELATVILVPVLVSLMTGVFLYLLTKKSLGEKKSLLAISIWTFSPFLVNQERVLWNPILTLLSSSLIFFPLLSDKKDKWHLVFLFLGSFLAYQAHFSGFVLLFLASILIIFLKKKFSLVLPIVFGFLLSIIPTIIFDLKNGFLNVKGFLKLLTNSGDGFNLLNTIKDIFHNFYIIVETLGKVFLFGNNSITVFVVGLLLIFSSFIFLKRDKNLKLSLWWLVLIATTYSFYNGEKPEYYFLISLPVLIYLSTSLIDKLKPSHKKVALLIFFANSFFINLNPIKVNSGSTVGSIAQIQEALIDTKIKKIYYDVSYGADHGLKYFFDEVVVEDGQEIHIGYSKGLDFVGVREVSFYQGLGFTGFKTNSDLAVWADQRQVNKNYISVSDYFLETNQEYFLYEDNYPRVSLQRYELYKIVYENQVIGELVVANEQRDKLSWVKTCIIQRETKNYAWVDISDQGYIKYSSPFCLQLKVDGLPLDKIEEFGIRIF